MITLITLHMLSRGNYGQAMGVLTKNTELARKAKGFVSRRVLIDVEDRLKGYSITTWESREDMDAFLKSPERPTLEFEGEEMKVYEKTSSGRVLVFTHVDTGIFKIDVEAANHALSDSSTWKGRYAQVSLHMLDARNRERALDVLRGNTSIAAKQEGFVSRQVYVGVEKPLKGYSVATWETKEAMEAFRHVPGRPVIVGGEGDMKYEKTTEGLIPVFPLVDSRVFQTVDEA